MLFTTCVMSTSKRWIPIQALNIECIGELVMHHCICKKYLGHIAWAFLNQIKFKLWQELPQTTNSWLTKKKPWGFNYQIESPDSIGKNLENTALSRQVCLLAISWAPGTKVSLQSTLCFWTGPPASHTCLCHNCPKGLASSSVRANRIQRKWFHFLLVLNYFFWYHLLYSSLLEKRLLLKKGDLHVSHPWMLPLHLVHP